MNNCLLQGIGKATRSAASMLWICAVMLLIAPLTGRSEEDVHDTLTVKSAAEALKIAYEYTGFDELRVRSVGNAKKLARLMTVEQNNTPYLYEQVIGRKVWHISLDAQEDQSTEIWIDAESGHLIKVKITREGFDPEEFPGPPGEHMTEAVSHSGHIYKEFMPVPPTVRLRSAFREAIGAFPNRAKQVIAECVLWSRWDKPFRPVWVITGRGVPMPSPRYSRSDPRYLGNAMRAVVDATDGRAICSSTAPCLNWKYKLQQDSE